ncbi:fimbrial protein TcfA [Salmonella enterica]|nr:fimbrial protein TcfA [Salmonella enterica]
MNFKDTLPGGFLCVAMFACGHARANMLVYPMAAEINSSREEATSLFVYSKSDHVQYIRTRIMRIEHPGMPQEKEVPAGNDIETGLVVSPEKFALSPGTKKTIRVISTQAPEREEAWRVLLRVSPSDPRPALVTNGHHLLNTGNTRLSLIRAGNCDTTCHWQNIDKSIYPGGSADIPAGIKSNAFRVEYRTGANSPVISADLTAAGK